LENRRETLREFVAFTLGHKEFGPAFKWIFIRITQRLMTLAHVDRFVFELHYALQNGGLGVSRLPVLYSK